MVDQEDPLGIGSQRRLSTSYLFRVRGASMHMICNPIMNHLYTSPGERLVNQHSAEHCSKIEHWAIRVGHTHEIRHGCCPSRTKSNGGIKPWGGGGSNAS